MSRGYFEHINNSFPSLKTTHVRFVVKDKVKAQVINSQNEKVIREIPQKLTSNILMSLYA